MYFKIGLFCTGKILANSRIHRRFLSEYHGCIIGSGPSGLYLAQYLLKNAAQNNIKLHLDIYDKLFSPYGLVRYGVAPDHQDVKKVETTFERTLTNPNVSLLSGVDVGKSVSLTELMDCYDFSVLKSKNIFTGQSFVGWYNGHPASLKMSLPNLKVKNAVVIGLGNVAIDVARLLLTDFNDPKNAYDIPEPVLDCLRGKEIEKVFIVGRGGIERVAFTLKEFRELTKKPNLSVKFDSKYTDNLIIEDYPRNRQRLLKFLKDLSFSKIDYPTTLSCNLILEKIPQKFVSTDQKVHSVIFKDKQVVTCIGYSGVSIDPRITFDPEKGCIHNLDARILSPEDKNPILGLYCNGWLKTGPKGTIANTLTDTYGTVDTIMDDILKGKLIKRPIDLNKSTYGKNAILKILEERGIYPKSFEDWKLINKQEKQIGESRKKIREKIVDESLIKDLIKK